MGIEFNNWFRFTTVSALASATLCALVTVIWAPTLNHSLTVILYRSLAGACIAPMFTIRKESSATKFHVIFRGLCGGGFGYFFAQSYAPPSHISIVVALAGLVAGLIAPLWVDKLEQS